MRSPTRRPLWPGRSSSSLAPIDGRTGNASLLKTSWRDDGRGEGREPSAHETKESNECAGWTSRPARRGSRPRDAPPNDARKSFAFASQCLSSTAFAAGFDCSRAIPGFHRHEIALHAVDGPQSASHRPLLEELHRIDQGAVDSPEERYPDKAPRERQFQWRRAPIVRAWGPVGQGLILSGRRVLRVRTGLGLLAPRAALLPGRLEGPFGERARRGFQPRTAL